ncbi:MAG: penicillin-binding protein 2 [Gammaproteobacteria bacterium]|nr:MAG: penicillin-binding protein 2 [Gammaproteobacteria bacterium]
MLSAVVGLVARAADLQIRDKEFLQNQGDVRHMRTVEVPAYRGAIVDKFGEPLAISTPVDSVWANPKELLADPSYISQLAKVIGFKVGNLQNRLEQRKQKEFIYLRRRVQPHIAEQVKDLKAPGVGLQREYQRFYPSGEITGHVTGFTDIDDNGQEGLELAYDKWLQGEPGAKKVLKDRFGRSVEDVENIKNPSEGKKLQLSIDKRVQFIAYRELKKAVTKHKARSGSAVVLDAVSGEILAMVNQPSYNPNNRSEFKGNNYRNRALTDLFEPGSTIKPLAVATALDLKIINPNTKFNTAPGWMRIGKNTIKDVRDYGTINVKTILAKSSNVGISKIALAMSPEKLVNTLFDVGFGVDTGSSFPGEASGQLTNKESWHDIERATLSFGYGISTTTLQLAQAYTVFANKGRLKKVRLIGAAGDDQQELVDREVFSERTAKQVLKMMELVTSDEGTAPLAQIPNYRVAGKTGTVKKSIAGGYSDDKYLAVFAGVAPVSKPRFVMVVTIDEPSNGEYYSGKVAAPVFSEVMADVLRLMNVAPDNLAKGNGSKNAKGATA